MIKFFLKVILRIMPLSFLGCGEIMVWLDPNAAYKGIVSVELSEDGKFQLKLCDCEMPSDKTLEVYVQKVPLSTTLPLNLKVNVQGPMTSASTLALKENSFLTDENPPMLVNGQSSVTWNEAIDPSAYYVFFATDPRLPQQMKSRLIFAHAGLDVAANPVITDNHVGGLHVQWDHVPFAESYDVFTNAEKSELLITTKENSFELDSSQLLAVTRVWIQAHRGALVSRNLLKLDLIDQTPPTLPLSVGFARPYTNNPQIQVSFGPSMDAHLDHYAAKFCADAQCSSSCTAETITQLSPALIIAPVDGAYYACVQAYDEGDLSSGWAVSLSPVVLDRIAPVLTSISSSAVNGLHAIGDTIPITVRFSEDVLLNSSGNVSLTLETGATDRVLTAPRTMGNAEDEIPFTYVVASGESSMRLDAHDAAAFRLPSGSQLEDRAGNAAVVTVPLSPNAQALAVLKNIEVDGVAPIGATAVAFAETHSYALNFDMNWVSPADPSIVNYEARICSNSACDSSCSAPITQSSSPATFTGAPGTTYYGCVRSKDAGANGSPWVIAAGTHTVDAAPVFAGVASGEVLGSFADGKAKVRLSLINPPVSVQQYRVYFSETNGIGSFDFNMPAASFSAGDALYDTNAGDTVLTAAIDATKLLDGYYVVRYYDPTGTYTDTNVAISTFVAVLQGHPGYALVPKAYSGLAYDYFMMRYEASLSASGINPGTDSVTTTETSIAACSHAFHQSGTVFDASCGSRTMTKTAQSVKNTTAASSLTWSSAFVGCRNASDSNALVRLPTPEEWQRASRWLRSSYTTMRSVYTDNAVGHCNSLSSAATQTGNSSECHSGLGLMDVAGNLKEWVDRRIYPYNITTNAENRFSYGPVIGQSRTNGIDNISQRFHLIVPSASGLGLAMGADYLTPAAGVLDQKQYGDDVQTWIDPTTTDASLGFRCLAFKAASVPTMAELSLADEPKFTSADLPAAAADWKIPENYYVKDNKWETLSINLSGSLVDSTPEGSIKLDWTPWTKTVCDAAGACAPSTSSLTYKIYRFVEPNRKSSRSTIPWALAGTGSAYGSTIDFPVDPLAVGLSGSRLFSVAAGNGRLVSTITNCDGTHVPNCTFTDSVAGTTGFSATELYNYVLVVRDDEGNEVVPQVQRFRSPYFAGPAAVSGAASFRLEPRLRRAGVFLVDEGYQSAQAAPQVMVHVPMDKSGLDHDFFIQKYEPYLLSGTMTANTGNDWLWPKQHDGAGVWVSNAGRCLDTFERIGVLDPASCGSGAALNPTTGIVASAAGHAPTGAGSQGASYLACRRSGIPDGAGNVYSPKMVNDQEWLKAADWGDVDHNLSIDQSAYLPNLTVNLTTLETGTADGVTIRCHTDNDPINTDYPSGSSETATCRSRFEVADIIGNRTERTSQQGYNGTGTDDGDSGLWFGITYPLLTGYTHNVGSRVDLFRNMVNFGPIVNRNDDWYWAANGNTAALRGGGRSFNSGAGRYQQWIISGDSAEAFRCSL